MNQAPAMSLAGQKHLHKSEFSKFHNIATGSHIFLHKMFPGNIDLFLIFLEISEGHSVYSNLILTEF